MQDLLGRFLAGRAERTARAYRSDVEDLARSAGESPDGAVARLLGNGPGAARRMLLDYLVDLRVRGLAPATIERRLKTLHALHAMAQTLQIVDWTLELPEEREIAAGIRERASQASYLIPRHPNEVNRLDLQHYAVKGAIGHDYLAPAGSASRVLDVGAGTGQWGFDVCETLPDALVVGLDLVPAKPGGPPGYRCVRGNILHGLPFRDGTFDYVHQRFLVVGIPVTSWPRVVGDIVRVTRPGGWVELTEIPLALQRMGPATERIIAVSMRVAAGLKLDTGDVVYRSLDGYLRDAGLVDVVRHEAELPVGHWAGQVGEFMATDFRAVLSRMCEALQARSQLSTADADTLIERALAECEQFRPVLPLAIAVGRKPSTPTK